MSYFEEAASLTGKSQDKCQGIGKIENYFLETSEFQMRIPAKWQFSPQFFVDPQKISGAPLAHSGHFDNLILERVLVLLGHDLPYFICILSSILAERSKLLVGQLTCFNCAVMQRKITLAADTCNGHIALEKQV